MIKMSHPTKITLAFVIGTALTFLATIGVVDRLNFVEYNLIFLVLCSVTITVLKIGYDTIAILAGIALYILFCIASFMLALFVASDYPFIASAISSFLGNVGYYPPGADAWFPLTAGIWSLSILLVCLMSVGLSRAILGIFRPAAPSD